MRSTTALLTTLMMTLHALSACESTPTYESYTGKAYAATTLVHVYFAEQDVRRHHEIMGEIACESEEAATYEAMERDLIAQAMAHGANAIVIEGMEPIVIVDVSSDDVLFGNPHYYRTRDEELHRRGEHPYWSTAAYVTEAPPAPLTASLIRYK